MTDVDRVIEHAVDVLGDQALWRAPAGYPSSLALCLLDSVWSLGARYEGHVVPVLDRYRAYRRTQGGNPEQDGGVALLRVFDEVGGLEGFASRIGNHQRTYSRSTAPLKASAVQQAARVLAGESIDTVADLRSAVTGPHVSLKRRKR